MGAVRARFLDRKTAQLVRDVSQHDLISLYGRFLQPRLHLRFPSVPALPLLALSLLQLPACPPSLGWLQPPALGAPCATDSGLGGLLGCACVSPGLCLCPLWAGHRAVPVCPLGWTWGCACVSRRLCLCVPMAVPVCPLGCACVSPAQSTAHSAFSFKLNQQEQQSG